MDSFEDILDLETTLLHEFGQGNPVFESLDVRHSRNPIPANRVHDVDETAPKATEKTDIEPSTGRRGPLSGCLTFPTTIGGGSKRKRAAFEDPVRRAKVAHVRKDCACLRCHIKKLPVRWFPWHIFCSWTNKIFKCSTSRPCMSCISCWVSLDARSSRLKWMGCVPCSWKDVNIYRLGALFAPQNMSLECSDDCRTVTK